AARSPRYASPRPRSGSPSPRAGWLGLTAVAVAIAFPSGASVMIWAFSPGGRVAWLGPARRGPRPADRRAVRSVPAPGCPPGVQRVVVDQFEQRVVHLRAEPGHLRRREK